MKIAETTARMSLIPESQMYRQTQTHIQISDLGYRLQTFSQFTLVDCWLASSHILAKFTYSKQLQIESLDTYTKQVTFCQ